MPKCESRLVCVAETARMITGNPANGTQEDPIPMSAKDAENPAPDNSNRNDNGDVVNDVCQFLETLPTRDGRDACIEEGRAIAGIVEPLGLPQPILAAVYAYPLYRDELISPNALQNNILKDIGDNNKKHLHHPNILV